MLRDVLGRCIVGQQLGSRLHQYMPGPGSSVAVSAFSGAQMPGGVHRRAQMHVIDGSAVQWMYVSTSRGAEMIRIAPASSSAAAAKDDDDD
eukprot:351987-Chlamydomonas_euryale.AAC.8